MSPTMVLSWDLIKIHPGPHGVHGVLFALAGKDVSKEEMACSISDQKNDVVLFLDLNIAMVNKKPNLQKLCALRPEILEC